MTAPPTSAPKNENKKPTLICFSHLRWDFVFQRPQHLLTRAAEHFAVIFIEEPIFVDGGDLRLEISERPRGIRVVQPIVPQGTPDADIVEHQKAMVDQLAAEADGELLFWYYTPMALPFSRHVAADVTVFDKMDELSAFKNAPPLLLKLEQELIERADVVFTGGASMYEAARHRHANIHCFPSSIDAKHFAAARAKGVADPADQAAIEHPRLGFFGVIDERMDVELVAEVADLRPDWQIVMIGPVVKIDPASLPQRPNIHWLGGKQYADLPAYLAHWDIGFMPFAINEATRFISPTKTPEFLAAGLPVVSTPITDVVTPYGEMGLVQIAGSPSDFVDSIVYAMAEDREARLSSVNEFLADRSWDRTFSEMNELIENVIRNKSVSDTVPASRHASHANLAV